MILSRSAVHDVVTIQGAIQIVHGKNLLKNGLTLLKNLFLWIKIIWKVV